MKKLGLVLLILLPMISPQEIAAEEALPLNLSDLIVQAVKSNPSIKVEYNQWQAAKNRVPQASSLPDPMGGYSVMGPMLETRLGPQKDMYEFEQMIPFPGKLFERRKMAEAQARMAEAKYKMTEQEVILRVKEVYYDLFSAEASLRILEEIRDLMRNFESIAQARYASQSAGQGEVAKAQAEVSEALKQIFTLRQQKETLVSLMNSLLNRDHSTPWEGLITEPTLPPLDLNLEELLTEAKNNRPELKEALAMKKREEHGQSLAKYEYAPDLTVGFQYFRIGERETNEADDGRDAWMIPIKFTIPLWQNRIVPTIAEAKNNLKASEARFREVSNETEYEIKRAFFQFTNQKQIVELYRNAFIPQAELAFRSDQAGYESGSTDILQLIDSERVYLNAKMSYYQTLAEVMKSFAVIERIVGKELK